MLKKILIFISLFFLVIFSIQAQDTTDLQKKINEYQEKLQQLKQQKNTLSSQIQYMDTQIYLTGLQISATEQKIVETEKEINLLGSRIEGLDQSLDYLSKLLIKRIVEGYKKRPFSVFSLILDNKNANDFLNQVKYLKTAQTNNQKLLYTVQETKTNAEEQKKLREEKKTELDKLTEALNYQKQSLNNQKVQKQKLLADTQNDEKIYQRRLSDAQRELSQVQGAARVLQDATPIQVKKGEFIGLQGNTGYSFGDHLHYGIYNYSSITQISTGNWYYANWVDPSEMLSSKTVRWDTGCESSSSRTVGNGNFEWPIDPSAISQGSGITCYSNTYYRGNPHPAWDMWGPIGTSIRASEEGKAYFCRNCLGDGGNGVFIFHPNGKMTLYWHLQ
ncbi:hypothetical protein HZA75_05175 [Candidatus Roizmanbacteria bacterium]|nr:hypothetical protein [Candidatus Roizmanbacteria bacterium]